MVTAIMVFEHFLDVTVSFQALYRLLRPEGRLVILMGDFEKYTNPRPGREVRVQYLASDEAATMTKSGERFGTIYDIHRTPKRLMSAARDSGFQTTLHQPIFAPQWLLKEVPRYKARQDKPQFHLLLFQRTA